MSPSEETVGLGSLKGESTLAEPNRHERGLARRSAEIRATVPHAEFTAVARIPERLGTSGGAEVTAHLVHAAAAALRQVPRLNGAYRDGRFEMYSRVNVGVTIAAEGLYVVPTVFDSDAKSRDDLAVEIADLHGRALEDRVESAELTGATFTISDLSGFGVLSGPPLTVGGQAGALSLGRIRAVPVIVDGAVVAGHEAVLVLTADHRIVQAPDAGRFLAAVVTTLETA